ncbi:MAG: HEAT repeat domain-containing protein [Deltaproteobacteria bacterium]|nr:HEAT repeat domain-containing protein [Deltaproteobacteria bacterium]
MLSFFLAYLINFQSHAFLSSEDPKNIFDLLNSSPNILVASVEFIKQADKNERYFIYQLKNIYPIKNSQQENIQVLQEQIFPGQKTKLKVQDSVLIFYTELPKFETYKEAQKDGIQYRVYGGDAGLVQLTDWSLSELVYWMNALLPLYQDNHRTIQQFHNPELKLFLASLNVPNKKIQDDAAQKLLQKKMTQGALSSTEINSILQNLRNSKLSSSAQTNLIQVLGRNSSKEELANIAHSSAGIQKWQAIRELEKLGVSWKLAKLIEDFNQTKGEEKLQALKIIIQYKKDEASSFLTKLLESPAEDNIKIEAIDKMVEFLNTDYEDILLQQLTTKNLNLKTYTMVALGKAKSKRALPILIKLLEDPNHRIKATARLALELSQDTKAKAILKERYERVGEGHVH